MYSNGDDEIVVSTRANLTSRYDRTPPCSEVALTQCSQFFHNIQISGLKPSTTYYYTISAANGTTESDVLSFTTARKSGDQSAFTVAVLNDVSGKIPENFEGRR